MKIDFTQELRDFAGEPLTLAPKTPNLTLGVVISMSVRTALQDDGSLPMESKLELDKIGELANGKEGEFTTKMATLIQERIIKVFTSPAVAGAVYRAIEG